MTEGLLETITCEMDLKQALDLLKEGRAVLKMREDYVESQPKRGLSAVVQKARQDLEDNQEAAEARCPGEQNDWTLKDHLSWMQDLYEEEETHEDFCEFIRGLPTEYWELFKMYHLEDASIAKIASEFNKSVGTVRNRFSQLAGFARDRFN